MNVGQEFFDWFAERDYDHLLSDVNGRFDDVHYELVGIVNRSRYLLSPRTVMLLRHVIQRLDISY